MRMALRFWTSGWGDNSFGKVYAVQSGKLDFDCPPLPADMRKLAVMGYLQPSLLETDRCETGAPCPDSLPFLISSRPARDPISKINKYEDEWCLKSHIRGWPLASICLWIHRYIILTYRDMHNKKLNYRNLDISSSTKTYNLTWCEF